MIFFGIEMSYKLDSFWHNAYYKEIGSEVLKFDNLEISCTHYPNKEDTTFEMTKNNKGKTLIMCTDRSMVYSLEKRFIDTKSNVFITMYGRDINNEAQLLASYQYDIFIGTIGRLNKLNIPLKDISLLIILNYGDVAKNGVDKPFDNIMMQIPESVPTIYFNNDENPYYESILYNEISLKNERRTISLESASDGYDAIMEIYETNNVMFSLIFCKNIRDAAELANKLVNNLFSVYVIKGGDESLDDMKARDGIISQYRIYICIQDNIPEAMYFPAGGIIINYLHAPSEDVYKRRCMRLCLDATYKNITYDIV